MILDHYFILTEPSAPEAEFLVNLGFVEGTTNDHPGQGTANRRFFFTNSALELLYIRDEQEARLGPANGLRLAERASDMAASPFGLIFRPDPARRVAPLPGWVYQPDYFGPEQHFIIGDNSELLVEPLCVYMPFDPPPQTAQPRSGAPFVSVTGLHVSVPVKRLSPVLELISMVQGVSVQPGSTHLMELEFNLGEGRQVRDLRPHLPMIIRW